MTEDMSLLDLGGAAAAAKPKMPQTVTRTLRRVDLPLLRTLAEQLASRLMTGDVVLLKGTLGAGKSEFARAIIQARMGDAIDVPSPTFTLVQTYETPGLQLAHADLYRIRDIGELAELGLDEAMEHGAVLVEWPERADGLWPGSRLEIDLSISGDGPERNVQITGFDDWAPRVAALRWDNH